MKISVYQTFNGYRVVAGIHRKAQEHLNIQPRVYDTAGEAYVTETDDSIRASILRIDSTAVEQSTPVTRHHVKTLQDLANNSKLYNKAARLGDSSQKFAAEHSVSKDVSVINSAPGTYRTKAARLGDSSQKFAAEHSVSKDLSVINSAPGTYRTKAAKGSP